MRSRIVFGLSLGCLLGLIGLARVAAAREWADVTGKFKIEAELVAVRNGKVILEKTDGTVITVPLDKLSAADQAFLKAKEGAAAAASIKASPSPAGSSAPVPAGT